MEIELEVSTDEMVLALANYTQDSLFNRAIDDAKNLKMEKPQTDFLSLFEESIYKLDPDVQLAPYFATQLRDRIRLTYDNNTVMSVLRSEAADAYDYTCQILLKRLGKFGLYRSQLEKTGNDRIVLKISGAKEPDRIRYILQQRGELQFWLGAKCKNAFHYLEDVNKYIASINVDDNTSNNALDSLLSVIVSDSTQLQNEQFQAEYEKNNPLFAKLYPNVNPENGQFYDGCMVGYATPKDRAAIDEMLAKARQKNILPPTIKFLWGAKPSRTNDLYELYAIQVTTRDGSPILDGGVISDARQYYNNTTGNEITITMDSEGAREWKRITGANVGEFIAIVLDDVVFSAPRICGEIEGGRSSITGDFTEEEAKDIANLFKSGKLPLPVKIVKETIFEQ
jgi:SecD/SecF fusion protein